MLSHSYALYSSLLDKDKYQTAQAHQQGIEAVRDNKLHRQPLLLKCYLELLILSVLHFWFSETSLQLIQ